MRSNQSGGFKKFLFLDMTWERFNFHLECKYEMKQKKSNLMNQKNLNSNEIFNVKPT